MSLDDIISLDVGGTRFDTTRQTLVKDPNSMLARMFDPASKMKPGMFLYLHYKYLKTQWDSSIKYIK